MRVWFSVAEGGLLPSTTPTLFPTLTNHRVPFVNPRADSVAVNWPKYRAAPAAARPPARATRALKKASASPDSAAPRAIVPALRKDARTPAPSALTRFSTTRRGLRSAGRSRAVAARRAAASSASEAERGRRTPSYTCP